MFCWKYRNEFVCIGDRKKKKKKLEWHEHAIKQGSQPLDHRPLLVYGLLGTGPHSRRWVVGKKVKLHQYWQPLPITRLTAWVPLSVISEADLDSHRSAKLTVNCRCEVLCYLKESSKINPCSLVITGQGDGEQIIHWGQLRDRTRPKARNGRIHSNIWLCALDCGPRWGWDNRFPLNGIRSPTTVATDCFKSGRNIKQLHMFVLYLNGRAQWLRTLSVSGRSPLTLTSCAFG